MPSKILTPLIVIILIIGFTVGQVFLPDNNALATSNNNQVKTLQNDLKILQSKIETLETQLASKTETETKTEADTKTEIQQKTKTQYAYVKQGNNLVNVREKPGLENKIIAKVYKGHPMQILKEENKWYQVKLENSKTGWVASWIVEVKEE